MLGSVFTLVWLVFIVASIADMNEICNKTSFNDTFGFHAIEIGHDIRFGMKILCEEEELILSIEAPIYNWVGFVFNTEMSGDAVIYTTGANGNDTLQLYDYHIESKELSILSTFPSFLTQYSVCFAFFCICFV